jgi:transposase
MTTPVSPQHSAGLDPVILAALAEFVRTQSAPAYVPPAAVAVTGTTPTVYGEADSELDALTAQYAELHPKVAALEKELKELVAKIKINLVASMPAVGATDVVLLRTPSLPRPLQLASSERRGLDAKTLRKDLPEVAAKYTTTTVVWTLQAVNG